MLRGLPLSILLHLLVLICLAVWGGMTPTTPLQSHHVLQVRMATLPEVQPEPEPQITAPEPAPPEPETTPPEPEPEPVAVQPEPEPEPILPPKEVPEEAADPEPEPDPEPPAAQPVPETQVDDAVETTPEQAEEVIEGPVATSTDQVFPFDYYLRIVQNNIARKWQPKQVGFRGRSTRACVVHFVIGRGGQVSQVTLVRSSGVSLFDREAIRAVRASRMPQLPGTFTSPQLGVTFTFTLKSGV